MRTHEKIIVMLNFYEVVALKIILFKGFWNLDNDSNEYPLSEAPTSI